MQNLFTQIAQVSTQFKKIQQELASKRVSSTAGGGMVEVTANGQREILSIKIEKELINPEEKEMLEDLICAAVNEALAKAQELSMEEMMKMAGDLNILGLLKGLV